MQNDEIKTPARRAYEHYCSVRLYPAGHPAGPPSFDAIHASGRELWDGIAKAARSDLEAEVAMLRGAVEKLILLHPVVEVDYTNYQGERGIRHISPISLTYGTNQWHPTPGFLITCWDHDRQAERVYSQSGVHVWDGVEVSCAPPASDASGAEGLAHKTRVVAVARRIEDGGGLHENAFTEAGIQELSAALFKETLEGIGQKKVLENLLNHIHAGRYRCSQSGLRLDANITEFARAEALLASLGTGKAEGGKVAGDWISDEQVETACVAYHLFGGIDFATVGNSDRYRDRKREQMRAALLATAPTAPAQTPSRPVDAGGLDPELVRQALKDADWSGASIGNKLLIYAAIDALATQAPDKAGARCIHCKGRMTADEVEYLTNSCNSCETRLHEHWQATEDGDAVLIPDTQPTGTEASRPVGGEIKTYSSKYQRDKVAREITNDSDGEIMARVVTDANVLHELIAAGRVLAASPTYPQADSTGQGDGWSDLSPAEARAEWRRQGLEEAAKVTAKRAAKYGAVVGSDREQRGDAEAAIALTIAADTIRSLATTTPETRKDQPE